MTASTSSVPPRFARGDFGRTEQGAPVERYALWGAGGAEVAVLTYGGVVQSLRVPDREGRLADVTLGYDDLPGYERDRFFFGRVVGRFANRIAGARFTLDGREYRLPANQGQNHLHGGPGGFHTVVWEARPFVSGDEVGVELRHLSPDGDQGYPGELEARVTYTLTAANELRVDYRATTTRPTPVNLTQHAYFDLAGEGSGRTLDHELTIFADRYTPTREDQIPTGEIAPVEGTPLDFRRPTAIGARIDSDHPQLRFARGYDQNFVLNGGGEAGLAARLREPRSGRVLEVRTTEPGMQFYSGNFMEETVGKGGKRYDFRMGLCLETQRFPDAPNQPSFPTAILRPGEERVSRTVFAFSAE